MYEGLSPLLKHIKLSVPLPVSNGRRKKVPYALKVKKDRQSRNESCELNEYDKVPSQSLIEYLDEALESKSIAHFTHDSLRRLLGEDHYSGEDASGAGLIFSNTIPRSNRELVIDSFDHISSDSSHEEMDLYLIQRIIFNLASICLNSEPKLFFSNEAFLARLRSNIGSTDAFFSDVIRVEPALLQTKEGLAILRDLPFYNMRFAQTWAGALYRKEKNDWCKHTLPTTHQRIKLWYLVATALEPKILKRSLKDNIPLMTHAGVISVETGLEAIESAISELEKHEIFYT